jgi:hypothetical protein
MSFKNTSTNILFGIILAGFVFIIISPTNADYDELPSLSNISSIAIYNMNTPNLPSQEQADYNITDQNLIAQIYAGFTKKTSNIIKNLESVTEGIIYLKLDDNSYKELAVFDNWDYLYVYSESPPNNIYYKISSNVRTLLIENAH